jgi:hypothetical protein
MSTSEEGGNRKRARQDRSSRLRTFFIHESLCRAARSRVSMTRQKSHSFKGRMLLLGHEPKMEMRHALHQRQKVGAVGPSGSLDCRDDSFQDRAKLGTLCLRRLAKIQKMTSGSDDDCSRIGLLQRSVLHDEMLSFEDVAARRQSD